MTSRLNELAADKFRSALVFGWYTAKSLQKYSTNSLSRGPQQWRAEESSTGYYSQSAQPGANLSIVVSGTLEVKTRRSTSLGGVDVVPAAMAPMHFFSRFLVELQ